MHEQSKSTPHEPIDLLVIGGGVNGSAIARDAAGRGLVVTLCEQGDIAAATSSWSSKLIHGGLRYLEQYEFKLVREALIEREVLMHSAPFLIHPLKFILPYEKHLRSPWLLRTGLFLYDHLAKRSAIAGSRKERFTANDPENALNEHFTFGFSYYDCQTDDARLTLLYALDAYAHNATILTHTQCIQLTHDGSLWTATLYDRLSETSTTLQARAVVNASGPWVDLVNHNIAAIQTNCRTRLVQGSHIVVPKLYEGFHAYILQNQDGRIIFAIPYLEQFTLIGTTDIEYTGDPQNARITESEINYLCQNINAYFQKQISQADIIWSYSGVRSLFDDHADAPSTTTREYHLQLHTQSTPPYLCVYGGKITTSRVLAEHALKLLHPFFPELAPAWTKNAFLPGGDLGATWNEFLDQVKQRYPWLPEVLGQRYARAYGSNIHLLIGDAHCLDDLGLYFGANLYEHEVLYWIQNEWAQSVEDILWRRSKLGLFLDEAGVQKLKAYIGEL